MSGQINASDPFGACISRIVSDPAVKTIVEVGTYTGLGSTRVIANSMTPEASFFSYENKRDFYRAAKSLYEDRPNVHIIYGRLSDRLMKKEDVMAHPMFEGVKPHFYIWYDDDKIEFEASPLVVHTLPETIDFVLLDGGEFSTQGDWHAVKCKTPKFVALDDCRVLKTCAIDMELAFDSNYELLDRGNARNGWAIYKRV